MGPWTMVALLVVLPAMAAPVTAAPYLQYHVDAARTGTTTDPGPAWPDHAFALQLPGGPPALSGPLIIGGGVFALVGSATAPGAYRVDLATAAVERHAALAANASGLASDGERLFVAGAEALEAYALDGSGLVWSSPWPSLSPAPGAAVTQCAPPALDGGTVFVACSQWPAGPAGEGSSGLKAPPTRAFARAVAAADGTMEWGATLLENPCATVLGPFQSVCTARHDASVVATSLAVSDELVLVGGNGRGVVEPSQTLPGAETIESVAIWALERATGEERWRNAYDENGLASNGFPDQNRVWPGIIASPETIYVGTGILMALEPETGATRWSRVLAPFDVQRAGTTSASYRSGVLGLADSRIVASAVRELVAFDVAAGEPQGELWRAPLSVDLDQMHAILQTSTSLYVNTWSRHVAAFEPATGRAQWVDRVSDGPRGVRTAVGEGVLVAVDPTGHLVVFGATPASIHVEPGRIDRYPAPGAQVRVDLSGTTAGVYGPPTRFSIDWGDGTVDGWQESPVFTHTYGSAGPHDARLKAKNDGNQTASTIVTFHVGGSQPNLVATAFARENQDLTFGVLGILLAVTGAVIAGARRARGRGRFQRERGAIEAAYARTSARPRDCEAALAERRARIQGLLLDHRLDEAQAAILMRRIDDLARDLRFGTLERRFQFLPYGFVMSLREMLADGVLSTWERDHLERAIEADRTMTADQKANVRTLLDEWAQADVGGHALV